MTEEILLDVNLSKAKVVHGDGWTFMTCAKEFPRKQEGKMPGSVYDETLFYLKDESLGIAGVLQNVAYACEMFTHHEECKIEGMDIESSKKHYQDAAAAIRQLAEELEI